MVPILEKDGNVVVAEGEQLSDGMMGSVDWLSLRA